MARRTDLIPAEAKAWIRAGRTDIALWAFRGLGIKLHAAQIEFAEAVLRGEAGYFLLTWGNRAGKLQPADEPVLTPTGWRPIGDLCVGDDVFAGDGTVTRVVGVFPQGVKPSYRLTFDDGATTRAGGEHLWKVKDPEARFRRPGWRGNGTGWEGQRLAASYGKWSVLTTEEMRARWGDRPRPRRRCAIPVSGPVEHPAREVPIDPYALGLLLGDGGLSGDPVSYTTADPELCDALRATGLRVRQRSRYGYTVHDGVREHRSRLNADLRALGLRGVKSAGKFVPALYLHNSPAVRLAVLQGLLDTDGSADVRGHVEFSTTSPHLAKDVAELVRSLGGKARTVKRQTHYTHKGERKDGRPSYRIHIRLPLQPLFRLERKQERVQTKAPRRRPERILVSIEPAGEAESVCIAVAHPDQTYITNDYIVTHNSTVLIVLHMHRLFYKLGTPPPRTEAEERQWVDEQYRTLHCAPLGELAGRAWLAIGDIINGTSPAQRDPETGKRRPAPLAPMYAATKERTESNADRLFLRCLTGAVCDFRSTEGKAARVEGGAWRLITWDEWPSTENTDDIRYVLYNRLTARASDHDAAIVLTGTITPETEHIAREFLGFVEDPQNEDWWGNTASRMMNPNATEKSLALARRNLDQGDYDRSVLGIPGGVKGRLFPPWLLDPAFDAALPAWQAPDKSDDGGVARYTYLHVWDLALAAADNVGMTIRVPFDWRFSVTDPLVGVSLKIIPGSRTLIDDEITFAIEETYLPYGGVIYVDSTDAHGKNIERSLRRKGLPAHGFDFKDMEGRVTRKARGIAAVRSILSEGVLPESIGAGGPVHDIDGILALDLGKPYGALKLPAMWAKPKDQLAILRPPPLDERQTKDAAMAVLMACEIAWRERHARTRTRTIQRAKFFARRSTRASGLSASMEYTDPAG